MATKAKQSEHTEVYNVYIDNVFTKGENKGKPDGTSSHYAVEATDSDDAFEQAKKLHAQAPAKPIFKDTESDEDVMVDTDGDDEPVKDDNDAS